MDQNKTKKSYTIAKWISYILESPGSYICKNSSYPLSAEQRRAAWLASFRKHYIV